MELKEKLDTYVKSISCLTKLLKKGTSSFGYVLEEILTATHMSGIYLFQLDHDSNTFKKTFFRIKENSGYLADIESVEAFVNKFDLNKSPRSLSVLDLEQFVAFMDIRKAAIEKEIFDELYVLGVKAVIFLPIYYSNRLQGYLRIDDCEKYREWDESTLNYLEAAVECIANILRLSFENKFIDRQTRKITDILNTSINALVVFGRDGKITEINETYAKKLDRNMEETLGTNVFSYFSQEIFEKRVEVIKEVFDTGEPKRMEDNDQGIWTDYKVYPIKDERGNIVEVAICEHDITKRKKLLEKFIKAENRYKALFENMSCCTAVYAAREDGKNFIFKDFNKAAEKLEGLKKELILGKTVTEVFPGVKKFGLLDVFKRVWETGIPEVHPVKKYEDDKIVGWRENYVYKLPSGEIVSLYTDVTDVIVAKEKLLERKKRLELAVMGTDAGLWDWNIKTDKIIYNKKWAEIIGYEPQELGMVTQENWFKLCHPDDLKKISKAIKDHFIGKTEIYETEIRLKHKNGDWVWVRDRGKIVERNKDNKPMRMAGTHIDITKVKKIELERDESLKKTRKVLQETILAISSALEIRDKYTAGHQKQVGVLAAAIGEKMSLSKGKIEAIKIAGLLHDIGKIYVPDSILNKPAKLTEDEYEIIKTHVEKGYDILKHISFSGGVSKIVKQHHERFDGSGYPNGLKGEEICVEGAILAVADVVDAFVSDRPYREALKREDALDELKKNRGILYNPEVVDACVELLEKDNFKLTAQKIDLDKP